MEIVHKYTQRENPEYSEDTQDRLTKLYNVWDILVESHLGFNLTPLTIEEIYINWCNSNGWVNTDSKGQGYWWCPHCMKTAPLPDYRHIATHWGSHKPCIVLDRRELSRGTAKFLTRLDSE